MSCKDKKQHNLFIDFFYLFRFHRQICKVCKRNLDCADIDRYGFVQYTKYGWSFIAFLDKKKVSKFPRKKNLDTYILWLYALMHNKITCIIHIYRKYRVDFSSVNFWRASSFDVHRECLKSIFIQNVHCNFLFSLSLSPQENLVLNIYIVCDRHIWFKTKWYILSERFTTICFICLCRYSSIKCNLALVKIDFYFPL